MAKAKAKIKEFEGELTLLKTDQRGSRFSVALPDEIKSQHLVEFVTGVLPADFEKGTHEVTGKMTITLSIRKK